MKKLLTIALVFAVTSLGSLRAHANTITQSVTLTGFAPGSGGIHGGFLNTWAFDPFTAEGTLNSVEFSFDLLADVEVIGYNIYPGEIIRTPNVAMLSVFHIENGSELSVFSGPSTSAFGDPVTVASEETYYFSATLHLADTFIFTDPVEMTRFFTSGAPELFAGHNILSSDSYGGNNANYTETLTVRYNYTVPDGGSVLLMLGAGLLALVQFRRRQ